jgi:hypothetical protein
VAEITIQGNKFEVPTDPGIVAGAILDEGMAHTLQQTRLENIRNNMAARIKKMLNGSDSLTQEQVAEAQGQVNEYATSYKFGERRAGAVRVVRDPLEKEMFRLAKEDLAAAFFAKHGDRLKGEALTENASKLLDAKRDEYQRRAKRNLADREKAGNEVLEAAGI